MIWFYPLNELDITGYEVLIVLLLSPLLLLIPPVKRFATSTVGLAIVRATAVLSLASYQAPTTPTRLIVLSTGNAAANIAMFGVLYGGCSARRRYSTVTHLLSFLSVCLSSVDTLWYGMYGYTDVSILALFQSGDSFSHTFFCYLFVSGGSH